MTGKDTALSNNRAEKIAKFKQNIPEIYHAIYEKAVGGKSNAAVVKARCLDCCCWQRTEVSLCPAVECPSWAKRPYQKASESENPLNNGGVGPKKDKAAPNTCPEPDNHNPGPKGHARPVEDN
jgi:hypothetical protein